MCGYYYTNTLYCISDCSTIIFKVTTIFIEKYLDIFDNIDYPDHDIIINFE